MPRWHPAKAEPAVERTAASGAGGTVGGACDGAKLFVRVIGSGAPVIVPLASWCEEFDALADRNQVILYDPRARGRSSSIDAACASFERDVADLETVREHLDLDMAAFVGWSYFCSVVARYAMLHPAYVARLALVGATPVRAGSFLGRIARAGHRNCATRHFHGRQWCAFWRYRSPFPKPERWIPPQTGPLSRSCLKFDPLTKRTSVCERLALTFAQRERNCPL